MKTKTVICLLLLTATCMARDIATKRPAKTNVVSELRPELKVFEAFLGTWSFEGKLPDEFPAKLMKRCKVGMNGELVVTETFTKNEAGNEIQIGFTVWRWDQKKEKIISHEFANHGSCDGTELKIDTTDESKPVVTIDWSREGSPVPAIEVFTIIDRDSYSWKFLTLSKDGPPVDGVWKKQ